MAALIRTACKHAWQKVGPSAKKLWERVWPATKEAVIDEAVQPIQEHAIDQLADALDKAGEGLKSLLTKPPPATTKSEILIDGQSICIDNAPPAPVLHRPLQVRADSISPTNSVSQADLGISADKPEEIDVIFYLLLAYNLVLLSLVFYLIWRGDRSDGRDEDDEEEEQ